jgi:hypothetical protein
VTNIPRGYDALTLHQWLWWELRCFDATFEGFQQLFEAVMRRADPRFMAIRPYGNIGDRKCDGLYFEDGIVFQVYSPDELTQAEVQKKVKEDLTGAVKHWKKQGLKEWVFVYNTRRGLAPDIPGTLNAYKKKYPWLKLDHLSNDALWEKVRALPAQARAEIVGAPSGYEHIFFAPGSADPETVERLKRGRFVLIHDAMTPIDRQAVADALHPDESLGPPVAVKPKYGTGLWGLAADLQTVLVEDAIAKSADLRPRFAVFSLSPIPLVIHLGFLLSDRVEVQTFQYDRDRRSWRWNDEAAATADLEIRTTGVPEDVVPGAGDVVVRVALSDQINHRDTRVHVAAALAEIDITVPEPDKMWLRSQEQLVRLAQEFRRVTKLIGQRCPDASRIHLFVCGPTPACVVIGQAINPRMMPPVELYEFDWQKTPRYEHVLTLNTDGARAVAVPEAASTERRTAS